MPLAVEGGVRLAVAGPVQPPRRGGAAAGAARAAAGVQGGRGLGRALRLPGLLGPRHGVPAREQGRHQLHHPEQIQPL